MRKLLLFGLALTTSGCLMTRTQVREQESRVDTQSQTVAMQRAQASDLEEQMRALNGRIETLENSLEKATNDKRASEIRREGDRKEYDAKLKIYEDALSKIEQQYLDVSKKLEILQAEKAASVPREKESGKKGTSGSSKNAFEQAEEEFKKKNFQHAVSGYQAYRENNPKGKNYAEATYKMGVSFQELGMKADALPFFNEVVEKYPKSKSAEKAKIRLKQLK